MSLVALIVGNFIILLITITPCGFLVNYLRTACN